MAPTKLTWSNLGSIRANMVLDDIPKHAGVYKLTFKLWGNTYTYIAEAGALAAYGHALAITRTILPPRAARRSIFCMIF